MLQITREEKAGKEPAKSTVTETDGANGRPAGADKTFSHSRSRSRWRTVTDAGQTNHGKPPMNGGKASATAHDSKGENKLSTNGTSTDPNHLAVPTVTSDPPPPEGDTNNIGDALLQSKSLNRPTAGGVAFPFKLSSYLVENGQNASTVTLESQAGVVSPKSDEEGKQLGESMDTKTEEAPKPAENGTGEQADEISGAEKQ